MKFRTNLLSTAVMLSMLTLPLASIADISKDLTPSHPEIVLPLLKNLTIPTLSERLISLEKGGERYANSETGKNGGAWVKNQFEVAAAGRKDISVNYFNDGLLAKSIIVVIKGAGELAKERVILGAHYDSVRNTAGIDDDGSGTVTLIEILDAIVRGGYFPNRTIELHAYSGEELGLVGSHFVAKQYKSVGLNHFAMIDMDMTMNFPKDAKPMIGVQNINSPNLDALMGLLADKYTSLKVTSKQCGMSDGYSWATSTYICEPVFSPHWHRPSDVFANVNVEGGLEIAKMVLAGAVELAEAQK